MLRIAMSKNYNVILIGIDTLRADHLGIYGYNRPTSPHIDALARGGMLFRKCFSQAPFTAPSFMSLMTSRYPTYHGITNNFQPCGDNRARAYTLDPDIPTLASVLRENGYRTGAFADGGNMHGKIGFSRGFDYYGEPRQDTIDESALANSSRAPVFHGPIPAKEIFLWLKEFKKENFFLFLHTYAVHSPWLVPMMYKEMFGSASRYAKDTSMSDLNSYISFLKNTASEFKNGDKEALSDYIALYDGAIRYADDFVGKLISVLDTLGILDTTILIFTSDHGEEFFEHGALGHGQLYNELLHVPLIVKIPGFGRSETVSRQVRSIDIMPTILELTRIKAGIPMHGASLLDSRNEDHDRVVIAETEPVGYAVQKENTKHIYYAHARSPKAESRGIGELYDVASDPGEKNNIAERDLNKVGEMFTVFENELHRLPLPRPKRTIEFLEYRL